MGKLNDQVALVTGAARGIGRCVAMQLAQEGAAVLINDLDEAPLREVAAEITHKGGHAHVLVGSVTADEFADRLVDTALAQFGRIDILVNNAGYEWGGRVDRTTDEQWHAMLDVHLTAPFRITRRLVQHWQEEATEAGHALAQRKIVNVSSIFGTHGAYGHIAYSAAKSGIVGLTLSLARELGPKQINVNAVAFGLIETRLTQVASRENPIEVQVLDRPVRLGMTKEMLIEAKGRIPLRRSGTAEEAAGAIVLLCLPESDYVTGQVLEVDGGMAI